VVGASRPGVPFVQHGRNADIAWTLLPADDTSQHSLNDETFRNENSEYLRVSTLGDGSDVSADCVPGGVEATEAAELTPPTCSANEEGETVCLTSDPAVAVGPREFWCPVSVRTEMVTVRQQEEPAVQTVWETHRGPVVTSVLLSSDARFRDRMVSLDSPILSERLSIEYLKGINRARAAAELLEVAGRGSNAIGRLLFSTKTQMGHVVFGNKGKEEQIDTPAVFESGLVVSSRQAQISRRIEELSNGRKKESKLNDVEFNGHIQCDASSEGARWVAQLVLDVLSAAAPPPALSAVVESDRRARAVATRLLEPFANAKSGSGSGSGSAGGGSEGDAALVLIDVLMMTMKRAILAPIQRDPDINRHFYARKEFSTLRGSAPYKQLFGSDSVWLLRVLELGQTNSSHLINQAGIGLDAFVLKTLTAALLTAEKYYGVSDSWSYGKNHKSFVSRSVRFPFSPTGVDFGRALNAGPYALPGGTDSVFQNGYEGTLDEKPSWNHPLASRFCLRSNFRY
jgi:hypothetical protein